MDNLLIAATAAGALLSLGLLGYIALRVWKQARGDERLPSRIASLEAELVAKSESVNRLEDELAGSRKDLETLRLAKTAVDRDLTATAKTLELTRADAGKNAEILTGQFRKLSSELLENHGTTLRTQNKQQIEALLKPLRERIVDFEKGLSDRHIQAAEQHAALKQQITQLGSLNQSMLDEAVNLSRALKGQTQTQGAWGEMILETILTKSGLREGEEYVQQAHTTDSEGRRLRPDVIVHLPDGEKVIVDSKVSLTAFETFVNSEDEDERKRALSAHVASMRAHIDELAVKDYAGAVGSRLDYVIMFVPIEGALAAALGAKPELTIHALERNVAIATPSTLMALLRTVSAMWRVERQHQNAEEIADRAGRLYDKFVGFATSLESVGGHIDQAKDAFVKARRQLTAGTGNLVRQVEMMKELGARTKKSLPSELLAEADDEPKSLATARDGESPDDAA